MTISINPSTKVITIPQSDLTLLGGGVYELDIDWFRLQLKDIEDSEIGMSMPDTHRHNLPVTVGGVTLSRVVEIINGYTITFQDTGTPYAVNLVGANSNISDVVNVNNVSVRSSNSAGLVQVSGSGSSGPTSAQIAAAVWEKVLDHDLSAEEIMKVMVSVLAGKISGAGTGNISIRDLADTKNRVVASTDSSGNRSSITLDP